MTKIKGGQLPHFRISVLTALALLCFALPAPVQAGGRTGIREVSYTAYYWRLARYVDNETLCYFSVRYEGSPHSEEIAAKCGESIAYQYRATPACASVMEAPEECPGLYLIFEGSRPMVESQLYDIPLEIGLRPGQSPEVLQVWARENLEGETVTRIEGRLDGTPFVCNDATTCEVIIAPTDSSGKVLEFWAVSSFGDRTETQVVAIRGAEFGGLFRVDVLGQPWEGVRIPDRAAHIWRAFPPDDLPHWLESPPDLATDQPYTYLAGRLIATGRVYALDCEDKGLLPTGYASPCGLDRARDQVGEWQNRLDSEISAAAALEGIPSALLKRLIAQESQFWPYTPDDWEETGPGHITPNGVDTLLLWDQESYSAYCVPYFGDDCGQEFYNLETWQQSMLRYAALEDSGDVAFIARLLRANVAQVGGVVDHITHQRPGALMSYVDMWRLALINYNAGPGCVESVLKETSNRGMAYEWGALAPVTDALCNGAASEYVDKITR